MRTCEDISQQSWLLHNWLEASPFMNYLGWQIRACRDGSEWVWDVVEPPEYGCGYFESGQTYPSHSKALLAARQLVRGLVVSHELTIVLEEFTAQGILNLDESRALIASTHMSSARVFA
jgi:hypothetical protein